MKGQENTVIQENNERKGRENQRLSLTSLIKRKTDLAIEETYSTSPGGSEVLKNLSGEKSIVFPRHIRTAVCCCAFDMR